LRFQSGLSGGAPSATRMPASRKANFADIPAGVSTDNFQLLAGNKGSRPLQMVALTIA